MSLTDYEATQPHLPATKLFVLCDPTAMQRSWDRFSLTLANCQIRSTTPQAHAYFADHLDSNDSERSTRSKRWCIPNLPSMLGRVLLLFVHGTADTYG
eukprot:1424285-Amphidinium_carterae.1